MPGPAFRRNETVGLHTLEEADLEFLQALRAGPSVGFGEPVVGPENMHELTEWYEETVADTDESEGVQFVVCPRERTATDGGAPTMNTGDHGAADQEPPGADDEGPEPIGFAALSRVERPAGRVDATVAVHPRRADGAYAAAATRELVAYAIEERRVNRVVAPAVADDDRARSVLETVGFTAEETWHQERRVDGEFVDVTEYVMLAGGWFDRPDTTRGIPDSPPGATAEARGHTDATPFAVEPGGDGGTRDDTARDDAARDDGGGR